MCLPRRNGTFGPRKPITHKRETQYGKKPGWNGGIAATALDYVRHITIDPRGPGVVRIHMIRPGRRTPADPFLLLLNGGGAP